MTADPAGDAHTPLLLYLTSSAHTGAYAIAPCLARLAEAAGWGMDIYVHPAGLGRHFGGGRPAGPRARGTSFIGGGHAEQLAWLARHYRVTAIGDRLPGPTQVLEHNGVPVHAAHSAVEIYDHALALFGGAWPRRLLVLDEEEQGPHGINTAAYCCTDVLRDDVLAVDVSEYARVSADLRERGVTEHECRWIAPGKQNALGSARLGPQLGQETYAQFTARCAQPHREWAKGLLLADPELVLSSIPRAARLRLVPLYGRPQIDVIDEYAPAAAALPRGAWGRQFDDRDFLWLSRRGMSMQLVDPGPPLHSVAAWNRACPAEPPRCTDLDAQEPSTDQLNGWADEGRILVSLIYWSGMVRELDAVATIADLLAATGLRAGLALTVPAVEHLPLPLSALAEACRSGGGRLEVLMASMGNGIAFESLLDDGDLSACLGSVRRLLESITGCPVRGWWPLLDGRLVPLRSWQRLRLRERRLVSPFSYTGRDDEDRKVSGEVRRPVLPRLGLLQARPFDWECPDPPTAGLRRIVAGAGFRYMVSKHRPAAARPPGLGPNELAVLPAVAGWGGWTPFRTVSSVEDVERVERRIARSGQPGCLTATVDAPLWLLSGERWMHGERMRALAEFVARGGSRGRMVNASPATVARYAAVLGSRYR